VIFIFKWLNKFGMAVTLEKRKCYEMYIFWLGGAIALGGVAMFGTGLGIAPPGQAFTGPLFYSMGQWYIQYAEGKVTKPFQSKDAGLTETTQPVTMWVDESKGTGTKELPPMRVTSMVLIAFGVAAFLIGFALCVWPCVLYMNTSTLPPLHIH
jgi:hypothetical protein